MALTYKQKIVEVKQIMHAIMIRFHRLHYWALSSSSWKLILSQINLGLWLCEQYVLQIMCYYKLQDTESIDFRHWTAIHHAAFHGRYAAVQVLKFLILFFVL